MSRPETHATLFRVLDGMSAWLHPSRRLFRRELLRQLAEARQGWPSADYGAGYLYQSFPPLGLRGFRRSEERVAQMGIGPALKGRSVLEVGCNTGFLSLLLAPGTQRYLAFDNNPYLTSIAKLAQSAMGDHHVEFRTQTIEAFGADERFDVVLSFANHSTWDGNMTLELDDYFAKLHRLLAPGGTLFFESHHPVLENDTQLAGTLDCLSRLFTLKEQRRLGGASPWDRGRTFVRASARAD
jgi:SAM-dependent methyltransferase